MSENQKTIPNITTVGEATPTEEVVETVSRRTRAVAFVKTHKKALIAGAVLSGLSFAAGKVSPQTVPHVTLELEGPSDDVVVGDILNYEDHTA